MNSWGGWVVTAAMLSLVLLAGCHANSAPSAPEHGPDATVSTCESLPEYDYERAATRVERIKGMSLERNLTICTERESGGIDATGSEEQFAAVSETGLAFFGLDPTPDTGPRSSLGHTSFSPDGGPIAVYLANESAVENVSWLSYEALVAHELSHAIDDSHLGPGVADASQKSEVHGTTDWLLANRAVSEGSAMYVSDLYVREYGGELTASKLGEDPRNWKHRVLTAAYVEGSRYSDTADIRSANGHRVNSTASVLHPERTEDPGELPARPDLPMESLEHVRTDRVGELFLRETFESRGLGPERAAAAADGWTNDRMDYYRANDSTVVTWLVTWESEAERDEFLAAYDAVYDAERVADLGSVECANSGRYLAMSEKTVTVLWCDD